jgi:hypothetical protein
MEVMPCPAINYLATNVGVKIPPVTALWQMCAATSAQRVEQLNAFALAI